MRYRFGTEATTAVVLKPLLRYAAMAVLFSGNAFPLTDQRMLVHALPANPLDDCGSMSMSSHEPIEAAARRDTTGVTALAGADIERLAAAVALY
jgi:hypothetical protein